MVKSDTTIDVQIWFAGKANLHKYMSRLYHPYGVLSILNVLIVLCLKSLLNWTTDLLYHRSAVTNNFLRLRSWTILDQRFGLTPSEQELHCPNGGILFDRKLPQSYNVHLSVWGHRCFAIGRDKKECYLRYSSCPNLAAVVGKPCRTLEEFNNGIQRCSASETADWGYSGV
jgi:hypothetical protein